VFAQNASLATVPAGAFISDLALPKTDILLDIDIDTSTLSLTPQLYYASVTSEMKPFPTSEVIRLVGVHAITLERWLKSNPDLQPKVLRIGGRVVRLWTMKDVTQLKRFKAHQRRGRKPKTAKR
jgi:hypothetical protein